MPLKKKPPLASRFSFTTTSPAIGALTTMLSIVRWANCMAPLRLVALLLEHGAAGAIAVGVRLHVGLDLRERALASSSASSFFLASIAPTNSLPLTSSSARRTSYRACSSATWSSAACTFVSASSFTSSCSASSSSDRA